MSAYTRRDAAKRIPRLPRSGVLDLTYRCNNHCRHCWSWLSPQSAQKQHELSVAEIRGIVDAARNMGCREWSMSGGEPMLRSDFPEIFDYVTSRAAAYKINSNGTLITPSIAQLMTRKGAKMIALYGATADVYDHVTRNPGGFEAAMRGMRYLKEAGAGFIVQIIPMRDNYHQIEDMKRLALSLSPHWRFGAAWLYLSSCGSEQMNREISRQRLDPAEVIALDPPDPTWSGQPSSSDSCNGASDSRLFAACAAGKSEFHIDAYGQMSFCGFIQDPQMRYDLRQGSFADAWDAFIPSLAGYVHADSEYSENCGSCELRSSCRWCPVYGYLEHGRFTAKVDYLCALAKEAHSYKQNWLQSHRRYYQCGGMTIQLDSDLPLSQLNLDAKFQAFQVAGPGEDNISISHSYALPALNEDDLGQEVYRKPPWAIYKKGDSWVYVSISPRPEDRQPYQVAVFSHDYRQAKIYSPNEDIVRKGKLGSLTFFPTDQILFAQLLADRQGCYLHSSGVVLGGQGLVFAGHSDAGKSTTVKMLQEEAEILCDDRIIVRRWPDGFRIHGTWSHGEVPDVCAGSAPLRAILFLTKDTDNRLVRLTAKNEITRKLLGCVIKPFVTAEWWQKTLSVIEQIVTEIPCYDMHFDKSGAIVDILRQTLLEPQHPAGQ